MEDEEENLAKIILKRIFQIFWSIIGTSIILFASSFFLQVDIITEIFGIAPTTRISILIVTGILVYFIITITLLVVILFNRIKRDKKSKQEEDNQKEI